jgi:predicted Zn-dependent protease
MGAAPKTVQAELPPYVHAYEPRSVDERGLWMEADEGERIVRDSSLLMKDEALNRYVKGVLCEAVGQDRCNSVRVYVLEVPEFNASMTPNGTLRVWTGLLLRVQNEAELASVLAHEFAHFELRHGLNGFKQMRQASDVSAWLSVLSGFANTNTSYVQQALLGSSFQFSRAQETEADLLSIRYLGRSPYPASAAASVWTQIMGESDARAMGRGLKPKRKYSAGFFDSHPTDIQRATYLKAQAEAIGESGDLRAKEYREALRPYLPRLLEAQVKSNDFGGTEFLLQQLSGVEGWTGDLLFARGALYRQRANPRDLASAATFFREAIGSGYADPAVHRELGLSLLRNGDASEGRAALQEYLNRKPNASDLSVIKALVGNQEQQ